MTNIKDLQEKQARILSEARSFLDQMTSEQPSGDVQELEASHDVAMAEFDRLGSSIQRLQQQEAAERALTAIDKRLRPQASGAADGGRDGMAYREAFAELFKANGRTDALSQEARAAFAEMRAQTTANSAGGYTVPTEIMATVVQSQAAFTPMLRDDVVTVWVTESGNEISFPTVNDLSVTAEIGTEGAALTNDGGKDVVFGEKVLASFPYQTEWLGVSRELAQDSIFNFETMIGGFLGERIGRAAGSALTVGTGSSQPNGIVTASALGKTAASATAITMDELIDLQHSVNSAYRSSPKCGWMFNDVTAGVLRKLKDENNNYLWQLGNVQTGQPDTLLGKPVFVNPDMVDIAAAKKVVLFGDFSKYYVRQVGQPLIMFANDSVFLPGFGIAGYHRIDGELVDAAAVKHLITAALLA